MENCRYRKNVNFSEYFLLQMKALAIWTISALLLTSSSSATITDGKSNENSFRDLLNSEETAWIEKGKSLTYVYDPDWAPFEWKSEKGVHTGIIADLLALIREKTGLKLQPLNTDTWSESVEMVRQGKADMFSAITVTDERKQYLDYTSGDIYSYPAVLLTDFDDNEVYLDLEKDARLKTIAIVQDSGLGQYIRQSYPNLNYLEVPSTKQGFTAVVNGDADLFAINTITARYFIEQSYQDEIKIATKLDYIYHLKIAVRKDRPAEVVSILDKALWTISNSEQNAIFNRWTLVEKKESTNWELIGKISAIFLVILVFLVWHNLKLKKLVNKKTIELSNLAHTDSLTGANNRRKLDIDFSHEVKRADRNHHKMALLYLDLNDFKKINDTHGHKFGDMVLQKISSNVIASLRDTEKLYRLGGDEFCILLPEITSKDQVTHAANRLKELMADVKTLNDLAINIGCSIGIAVYPDDGKNLDTLMTTADHEMYQAKTLKK